MRRVIALILMLLPIPAHAQIASCGAKPFPPMCLTDSGTFDSQYLFNHCRGNLLSYREEVLRHMDCLAARTLPREQAYSYGAQAMALDQLTAAFKYWNCRARGGAYCPYP